ncbi:MAG: hypothetical protein AXW15_11365 [Neptuniibacter sp. Phe_28]|nr:MAG: hypothetical protein AXW15_11365 [Neptuniibacter sp. Phe_28]
MKTFCNVEIANRYAEGVVSGLINECKYVVLACQRHLSDINKSNSKEFNYWFDENSAAAACESIQQYKHKKGLWARKNLTLKLQPWQLFQLVSVFGWKRKSDNAFRFRTWNVDAGRKNGLTTLATAVLNYLRSNHADLNYTQLDINAGHLDRLERQRVIEVLDGTAPDDELFGIIYTIDEDDDWESIESIRKANPNFEVSVNSEYLFSQRAEALKGGAFEDCYKSRHLAMCDIDGW